MARLIEEGSVAGREQDSLLPTPDKKQRAEPELRWRSGTHGRRRAPPPPAVDAGGLCLAVLPRVNPDPLFQSLFLTIKTSWGAQVRLTPV